MSRYSHDDTQRWTCPRCGVYLRIVITGVQGPFKSPHNCPFCIGVLEKVEQPKEPTNE